MKTALTIAGSDSSGGAGIQADIKTMTANGVYAMSAITALTAQNTTGVTGIFEATPEFLAQEIDAIFTDIYSDAVKIGMVSSAELIGVIAVADVIKINELNIERHTAQALQHTFGRVGLAVVNGMMHLIAHPLAQAAPAVEDGHLERRNVGLCALHIFVDLAELADHILNLVDKAGPVAGEL